MTHASDAHRLATLTEAARSWRGGDVIAPPGFVLESDEVVYFASPGVELVELRDTRPPLMGGSSAYEFDVARRMADGGGSTRSVWLSESVPARDAGWVVITDRRVALMGERQLEWHFTHLIDLTHDDAVPETWLTVDHRQRTSGIRYAGAAAVDLRFCLAVALAEARGARAALYISLVDQARRSGAVLSGPVQTAAPVTVTGKVPALLRRVYLGKPGTALPLRVAQGGLAALATLALVGSVLPDQGSTPATQIAVQAAEERSSRVDEQAQVAAQAAEAERAAADADRVAAEQAAADQEAADTAAADRAAADKEAAQKVAAEKAAAEKAAAGRAEADRLAAEAAAAQRAEEEAAAAAIQPLAAAPQSGSSCTPEYPDFCIPLGPADYDCGDFTQTKFTALAPDRYRLDGSDDDGVACEGNR